MAVFPLSVSSSLLWCLILAALAKATIYFRRLIRHDLSKIPGPFLARFTGLYRLSRVAGGQAPEAYRELHRRYGPIVRVGPNHVSISDPSAIPIIYGLGSKFFKTDFYKTMKPSFNGRVEDSMFTAQDPAIHKALKAPVASLFAMSSMRSYEPYVDECTAIFIAAMHDLEGQSIDLATWLQWYAFDVIAGITFQRRFGFLEQRIDVNGMISALDDGFNFVKILGMYPEMDGLAKGIAKYVLRRYDPLVEFVKISEEEITRYDESRKTEDRTDFLSQLRQREKKFATANPKSQARAEILNHVSNNLLAGSDTTAISLRACFYYLIKTPRVLAKLKKEIESEGYGKPTPEPVTLEASLKMPYLQAVMKEATRLHPGVGFPLERYVPQGGASICGIPLAAGTNVSMSAPVLQVDRTIFGQDANEFRPERWLESSAEQLKLMERSMLVFGHGARTCIGKNISIMEMGKFIPQILREFDIEWVSAKPEWSTEAAWFWKQMGMHVKFKRRRQL